MDTVQIYKFLHNMTRGKNAYFNCIPCDVLEGLKIKKFPAYLVVNNQTSTQSGEHWLAIYIPKHGAVKFFCSYGMGVDYYLPYFKNFLIKFRRKIIENFVRLQSYGSNFCGQYALFFLYMQMKGCCILSIYKNFTSNSRINDRKVKRFINLKNHLLHGNCKLSLLNKNQCCTVLNKL